MSVSHSAIAAGDQALPETFFAPAWRASLAQVEDAARAVAASPVVSALVAAYGSMVAVLNRQRQILEVNDGLLRFLGVPDAQELLGLRPGEAVRCVHAADQPNGCGTSRFCTTCGAAIAIVSALQDGQPQERECLLTFRRESEEALELRVRAVPLEVEGHGLVLLLLQDIRDEKRRQALEQVFFHDLNNTLMGVSGYAEMLAAAPTEAMPALAERLLRVAHLATDEVRAQQLLAKAAAGEYRVRAERFRAGELLEDLARAFEDHPVARQRRLEVSPVAPDLVLETDRTLAYRVLANMLKNALEATPEGGVVRVACDGDDTRVYFRVWNAGEIPAATALRMFQRYFSTKSGSGRGLGTYSMKLLGERYLGGRVGFTTDAVAGTLFSCDLPRHWNGTGRG